MMTDWTVECNLISSLPDKTGVVPSKENGPVDRIGPHPVLDAFYLVPGEEEQPEVHLVLSCWDHDHPDRDPMVAIILCRSRAEAEAMERTARRANTPEKIAQRGGVKLVDMGDKIHPALREQAEAHAREIIRREVPQAPAVH